MTDHFILHYINYVSTTFYWNSGPPWDSDKPLAHQNRAKRKKSRSKTFGSSLAQLADSDKNDRCRKLHCYDSRMPYLFTSIREDHTAGPLQKAWVKLAEIECPVSLKQNCLVLPKLHPKEIKNLLDFVSFFNSKLLKKIVQISFKLFNELKQS
jgi:hypothetical protein